MHRKHTKFAARVHRVASGIERRGVVATYELHDRLLANRASRRRFAHGHPQLDETQERILSRLRDEGYATLPLAELVSDEEVRGELEESAARFVHETEDALERQPRAVHGRRGDDCLVHDGGRRRGRGRRRGGDRRGRRRLVRQRTARDHRRDREGDAGPAHGAATMRART